MFNPVAYIKESRAELEKVVWITKSETIRLTVVVIAVSLIVGAYISGLDTILAKLTERFFIR